jgi:hypothetical protein
MIGTKELPPEMLYNRSKPDDLNFETTAELKTEVEIPGQARAAEAVRFGKIRDLNREVTGLAVGHLLDDLRQKYAAKGALFLSRFSR